MFWPVNYKDFALTEHSLASQMSKLQTRLERAQETASVADVAFIETLAERHFAMSQKDHNFAGYTDRSFTNRSCGRYLSV